MRIKKRTLKIIFALVVILLLIYFGYKYSNKPSYPEITKSKPLFGNKDASVKIVEYADLQCPACRSFHPVIKKILQEYGQNISLEFKQFPLSMHKNAFLAAQASECANDQDKFIEFVDIAYARQDEFDNKKSNNVASNAFKDFAKQLGLDETFNDCLDSGVKSSVVRFELAEANQLGLSGTPTIFVNGNKVSNSYEAIVNAIKVELESSE